MNNIPSAAGPANNSTYTPSDNHAPNMQPVAQALPSVTTRKPTEHEFIEQKVAFALANAQEKNNSILTRVANKIADPVTNQRYEGLEKFERQQRQAAKDAGFAVSLPLEPFARAVHKRMKFDAENEWTEDIRQAITQEAKKEYRERYPVCVSPVQVELLNLMLENNALEQSRN